MDDQDNKTSERKCCSGIFPTLLSIFLPLVAFTILIVRVASFRSETPINISNNATSVSMEFQQASAEEINNFLLLYWHDNMFIVPFGLFMAALLYTTALPTPLKLVMFCTTIPGHPTCDWYVK